MTPCRPGARPMPSYSPKTNRARVGGSSWVTLVACASGKRRPGDDEYAQARAAALVRPAGVPLAPRPSPPAHGEAEGQGDQRELELEPEARALMSSGPVGREMRRRHPR